MKRYLLTDEAREDMQSIRVYLKREANIRVAQSTLKKIRDAFIFLSHTPGAGHLREDLTNEPMKFWPVSSYLNVYNPALRPIEIIRVLHSSRDARNVLSDED